MNRRNFFKTSLFSTLGIATSGFSALAIPGSWHKASSSRLSLEFAPYPLKLKHAFNLARSSRTTTPDVLVRLHYDGITGYGEASMPPYLGESIESACKFLSKLCLEQFTDPFRIEEILDYVDTVDSGNPAAKASVDIALHDLLGKIMQQPWYKIWGLNPDKAPHTSFTIGIDTPRIIRQKVDEASQYKILKIKMGLGNDQSLVKIIREKTNVPICVDANQGWENKEKALEMCHWLAEQGCMFVEQPFDKTMIDETAWLSERSPLPIIADEFIQRLPDVSKAYQVYNGINIKLMKSTGMHEAYKMAILAHSLGMKVMIGCMTETSCAISAASQLSPMAHWADLDGNLLISNDPFNGAVVTNGRVIPTSEPGIGLTAFNNAYNIFSEKS